MSETSGSSSKSEEEVFIRPKSKTEQYLQNLQQNKKTQAPVPSLQDQIKVKMNVIMIEKKKLEARVKELEDQMEKRTVRLKQERHLSLALAEQIQKWPNEAAELLQSDLNAIRRSATQVLRIQKRFSFKFDQSSYDKISEHMTKVEELDKKMKEEQKQKHSQQSQISQIEEPSLERQLTKQIQTIEEQPQVSESQIQQDFVQEQQKEYVSTQEEFVSCEHHHHEIEEQQEQCIETQFEAQIQQQIEDKQKNEIQTVQLGLKAQLQSQLIQRLLEENQRLKKSLAELTKHQSHQERVLKKKIERNIIGLNPINKSIMQIQLAIMKSQQKPPKIFKWQLRQYQIYLF